MRRPRNALAAAALAVLLPLAGCGGTDSGGSPAATTDAGTPVATADTGAAKLRSRLSALLTDHVLLSVALVRATAAAPGATAPPEGTDAARKAASAALDANAAAIARTLGAPDGSATTKQILALLRRHDADLLAYATGRAAKDEAAVQRALADLDDFRLRFAEVVSEAEPKVRRTKLSEDLKTHIETLAAAIDATVAGDRGAADRLATAAAHMPQTAALLADGLVAGNAERYPGEVDGGAAVLRANLTGLLAAGTGLTLAQADAVITSGARSPAARAAATAVAESATTLSESISSVYGEEAGQRFLRLERDRAEAVARYAAAKDGGDAGAATAALTALSRARAGVVGLLAEVDPKLDRAPLARALARRDEAATSAIRAATASSPKRFARTSDATAAAAAVAGVLARGITLQFPEKFAADA